MPPAEGAAAGRRRLGAHPPRPHRRARLAGAVLVGLLAGTALLTGFLPSPGGSGQAPTPTAPAQTLRLGYFANVTHAPALIAQSRGLLGQALGADGTAVQTQVFNAGPAAIEALNSGALDAAYLGPSPALNSYLSSGGTSLRVVAGAAQGGASLVVSPRIGSIDQLAGTELATPQYGGTQDVALRHFLLQQGLEGSVTVSPSSNGTVPQLFTRGAIDGAWLPEPHASLLVEKYGARRLVDEAELWPQGKFPTTVLVVNQDFLAAHAQTVAALVEANGQAIQWLNTAPQRDVLHAVQQALIGINGSSLDDAVIASALKEVSFDQIPPVETFAALVEHAAEVGIGEPGDVSGLVDERWMGATP